jgi:glutamyl-tRNA synthetase
MPVPRGRLWWRDRYGAPGDVDGPEAVGDVVLRRADGFLAYHLATAVDELTLGISDVLRGDDLWSSTAAQVAVMAQLGAGPPRYGHVPLWRDGSGHRLCKREGSAGLAGYRSRGLTAAAVIGAMAASAGLVPEGSELSAQELLADLDWAPVECRILAGF